MARTSTSVFPFALLIINLFVLLASPAAAYANGTYTKPPISPTLSSTSNSKPNPTSNASITITTNAALSLSSCGALNAILGCVLVAATGLLGLGL
ncbi:uncharacterized protein RAG0_01024 [Rhynchosporium agropyri]|uniref:Uncharacterized protein n=1 Tax=Rhynchosporium agropyri TaxID=914238 RepID=A0A1E1JV79_9HELO|nr:uncharacterized protein RAG0_01024 [Rhynchosporium agropyri]